MSLAQLTVVVGEMRIFLRVVFLSHSSILAVALTDRKRPENEAHGEKTSKGGGREDENSDNIY